MQTSQHAAESTRRAHERLERLIQESGGCLTANAKLLTKLFVDDLIHAVRMDTASAMEQAVEQVRSQG